MHAEVERQPGEFELRGWHHGVIFLLACAVIISRRPDAVLNGQSGPRMGMSFLRMRMTSADGMRYFRHMQDTFTRSRD
jgi:hypothetical protein